MYNLRSRGRVTSAGSARPHLRMGARALQAVASQVTLSQAVAMLDNEMVPETELFGDDDKISGRLHRVILMPRIWKQLSFLPHTHCASGSYTSIV